MMLCYIQSARSIHRKFLESLSRNEVSKTEDAIGGMAVQGGFKFDDLHQKPYVWSLYLFNSFGGEEEGFE